MTDCENAQVSKGEVLPEFWPVAAAPEVARAWWIPWPVAILLVPLLWVSPKRMGVHFAAVRWPGVILGHLLWTIYGIGCVDLAYWAPHYGWIAWLTGRAPGQADPGLWPPPSAWDIFRAPLALEAVWLGQTISSIEVYLLGWGAVLGVEVGLAAIGLLLMPYVTVGERIGPLIARCIKLTLWATTSAVPLGLALQAAVLKWEKSPETLPAIVVLICCGYVAWLLWMWRRSGLRYWGPAEGYAWQPRRPSCERCGYTLTGLTAAHRCPECGREVAESMPERRRLTPYAAAKGLDRIPALFTTVWRVLTQRTFFERLAVHGGHEEARSFAITMCLLAAGVAMVAALPGVILPLCDSKRLRLYDTPAIAAMLLAPWVGMFVVMLALSGLAALIASVITRRPLAAQAAISFWHSPWYLPLGVVAALGASGCVQAESAGWSEGMEVVWIGVVILAVITFVIVLTRVTLAPIKVTHRNRFANA